MEVFCLSCLLCKAPVIDRQVLFEELICLSDAAYAPESHLFDQTVLKGTKEPLHPSFCLHINSVAAQVLLEDANSLIEQNP